MMMRASVTSLLVILSIFCSSTWAYHVRRQQVECEYGIPCPGGSNQCISEYWLCDGDNDCGDNSDENIKVCQANGAYQIRTCMAELRSCYLPLFMIYGGSRPEQILEPIMNTDLRETCGPVLAAEQCVLKMLSTVPQCQISDTEHPAFVSTAKGIRAMVSATDYICRDHVEEFDEHKACLLRYNRRGPLILQDIGRQCSSQLESMRPPTFCPSTEGVDCIEGVVSAQCGPEVAGLTRRLGRAILDDIDCTRKHKRFEITKMTKEMSSPLKMLHNALSSLF